MCYRCLAIENLAEAAHRTGGFEELPPLPDIATASMTDTMTDTMSEFLHKSAHHITTCRVDSRMTLVAGFSAGRCPRRR